MDDLNTKIALKMQEVADEEFGALAPLMDVGSYTAHQVFEHFDTIRKNGEERMKAELKDTTRFDKKAMDKYIVKHRAETLSPECMEEVSVKVESFKCCFPRYILFKVLHKFEVMASIPGKNRKKFIRQAASGKEADVSFQVGITKPMMAVSKAVSDDKLRLTLQRVALDFSRGYVVASDGHFIAAAKADYQQVASKDGAQQYPVMMTVQTFKQCQGNLSVSVEERCGVPNKYRFLADDGGYYEEEFIGRFPNWMGAVPRELFRSGRVSLSKENIKQMKNFAKMAVKNGIGKRMWMECDGNTLMLNYEEHSTEQTFSKSISLNEPASVFTIGLRGDYVSRLDGWNGTMWVSGYGKVIIFDKDEPTDFYLLMPMMLPTSVEVHEEINGTKVSFEERHTEYQQTDGKQNCKQTSKQKKELIIHNSELITQIFMAAGRYEGTQPFYTLEEIERGEFKVRGNHDSELVLFLRTAAHYIRQDQDMQAEFCSYCREQMSGKDWRSIVPLEEMALAELFEGFLSSKGIDDIPDVEFEDENEDETEVAEVVEEAEEVEEIEAEEVIEEPESYTFCITGTLDHPRKFYQEEIEKRGWRLASKMSTSVDILVYGDWDKEGTSNKVKQALKHGVKTISSREFCRMLAEHPVEAEEVIEEVIEEVVEATIKPMAIEREIVPTLELETSDGKLVVAGESYFHKLYDEDEGCFRSEAAEAKFNEIDAFIADELITAEELDYAAIAQAVGEFMEEVAAS